MPYALCLMPYALCLMPYALCLMPYCITFRSKSDAYLPAGTPATTAVGRPTTNAESSSTEGKTPSRSLYGCGSSAPAMLRASMLRRGGQMKPDLDENLDRLVRISAGAIIAG